MAIFMAVNMILLPFAYIKTVAHKIVLLKRFKSSKTCESLFIYILLGIPFLIASQFVDAYYFLAHSYSAKQRQISDKPVMKKLEFNDYKQLLDWVEHKIDKEGIKLTNAT